MQKQSTNHIMLIEPAEFYANPETMETNVYQIDKQESREDTLRRALKEFHGFREMLEKNGVKVTVAGGKKGCPDILFPNWISTHEGGGMILYPMLNESRRAERSQDIIDMLTGKMGYKILHDLRGWEKEKFVVESTGSLCLDRMFKTAYAALSKRTDIEAVREWGTLMGYDVEIFKTRSHTGMPVYHTDLVMFIGTEVAAVCKDCILEEYRDRLMQCLYGFREIVELTMAQQQAFCGNSLEVIGEGGDKMLVMSDTAFNALTEPQKARFGKYYKRILHAPIPTIEMYGGGSARCLMLELF